MNQLNNIANTKNNAITYLKALGIMLMVLGHSQCNIPYVCGFLSMFHMPLFFIVAGYCLKEKYLDMPKDFFTKRFKSIYIPYVKWGILFALLHNPFFYLHFFDEKYGFNGVGQEIENWQSILHSIWLIATQMRGADQLLGGYWFLNALFFGLILAWILLHYVRNPKHSLLAAIAIFTVAHLTNFHIVFLNINTRAFAAALFIVIGYFLAQMKIKTFNFVLVAVSFAITLGGIGYWHLSIDMTSYDRYPIFPYILTATLTTWGFYSLFVRWKETDSVASRVMRFIGENTLTILTWHLLIFKFTSYIIVFCYDLPVERVAEYPVMPEYAQKGWWTLYWLMAVVGCCVIALTRDYIKKVVEK